MGIRLHEKLSSCILSLNKYLNAPVCAPFENLPPPTTEMVPPISMLLSMVPSIFMAILVIVVPFKNSFGSIIGGLFFWVLITIFICGTGHLFSFIYSIPKAITSKQP
jgi:hypothetical protein